jgi:RNA polymerase sigma factor (sigma-70 family)
MKFHSNIISEDELVRQNIPLVISIASKFRPNPPNDYDDIISVGMIGLLKAIRAFDPSRGLQLSTLATNIIRREIIRELSKTNNKKNESLNFDLEESSGGDNIIEYLPSNISKLEQKILYLRFHLGYTFDEIGNEFNKTKQWANTKFKLILDKILISNEKKENIVGK